MQKQFYCEFRFLTSFDSVGSCAQRNYWGSFLGKDAGSYTRPYMVSNCYPKVRVEF